VEKTDYSLGFIFAFIIHVIALFLLGMTSSFIQDVHSEFQPQADTMTLSLVEDLLSDNPSPKNEAPSPRLQPDTPIEFLRMPQPLPERIPFTDHSSDLIEIPQHIFPDFDPPSPAIVNQPPSVLPDTTVMPTLSTLLSSQEPTDTASLNSDVTKGMFQGVLIAPTTKDQAINPKYPMNARRKGEQGRVILDVLVSNNGKAASVTLVSSSGFKDLDTAAKDAVIQAKFKPGERNGKAVEASTRITILFQLNQN
jgi:protein TonB